MESVIKTKHNRIWILVQFAFVILFFVLVYSFYPRVKLDFNGSFVRFNSVNANVIVIADNPDFINSRYVDFNEVNNFSVSLKPGKYYWKTYNGLLESFTSVFDVDSEVGLSINNDENGSDLVNVGNVKLNVTKNKDGQMVGKITLEPNDKEKINNRGEEYVGREA